jgi:hypothetical protein
LVVVLVDNHPQTHKDQLDLVDLAVEMDNHLQVALDLELLDKVLLVVHQVDHLQAVGEVLAKLELLGLVIVKVVTECHLQSMVHLLQEVVVVLVEDMWHNLGEHLVELVVVVMLMVMLLVQQELLIQVVAEVVGEKVVVHSLVVMVVLVLLLFVTLSKEKIWHITQK